MLGVAVAALSSACCDCRPTSPASDASDVINPKTTQSGADPTGTSTVPGPRSNPVAGALVTGQVHEVGVGLDTGLVGALSGVLLRIEQLDSLGHVSPFGTQTTNARGEFGFSYRHPSTLRLTFQAPGFQDSVYIVITQLPTVFVSVFMRRASN